MGSSLGWRPRAPLVALVLGAALLGAGCPRTGGNEPTGDTGANNAPVEDRSLYGRLGGIDGIRAVVDEMVGRMAADPRIQAFFVRADFRRLKSQLVVELCELSGGPCRYRGRTLRRVHHGRGIQPAHFEAMIEDTRDALRAMRVGDRERDELLSILRSLEPDIVEAPE
jgi:hemoglobin